jgi:hypothetical protein
LKRAICTTLKTFRQRPSPRFLARAQPAENRECIILSDLTDCLLEAYDSVTRRAYQKFVERNGKVGGEVDDWLSSEREVLLAFPVNLQESAECVYALATIPHPDRVTVAVGVESQWLIILANRREDDAVTEWTQRADKLRVLSTGIVPEKSKDTVVGIDEFSRCVSISLPSSASSRSNLAASRSISARTARPRPDALSAAASPQNRPPAETACIVQLPVQVDRQRSIAIFSNGLLAIRMPKTTSRAPS